MLVDDEPHMCVYDYKCYSICMYIYVCVCVSKKIIILSYMSQRVTYRHTHRLLQDIFTPPLVCICVIYDDDEIIKRLFYIIIYIIYINVFTVSSKRLDEHTLCKYN